MLAAPFVLGERWRGTSPRPHMAYRIPLILSPSKEAYPKNEQGSWFDRLTMSGPTRRTASRSS